MTINPQDEYRQLRAFYEEAGKMLDWPDEALFGARPDASAWTPAQHLYHILRANGGMLKAVQVICEGGDAVSEEAELGENARAVLEAERMPRGRFEAPRRVRPPDAVSREEVRESLARSRRKLEEVGALLPEVSEAEGGLPHPFVGMLGAVHWLRFARIHSQHHRRIIRVLVDQQDTAAREASS